MADWEIESGVLLSVLLYDQGPLDEMVDPVDITEWVRKDQGITIRRGRPTEFDTFQPGSCSFELDNSGRRFDPTYASSPFADMLKPNRMIAVAAAFVRPPFFTFNVLFTGFLKGWPQDQLDGDLRPTVSITATDYLAVLARTRMAQTGFTLDVDRLDQGRLGGDFPQQTTGQRVDSALGLAGINPPFGTLIDDGVTTMPELVEPTDALAVCQLAEQAEAGFFFVAGPGQPTFLGRHARFLNPLLAEVQATFTDCEYPQMAVDYDLERVWNDVRFNRPDGEPQIARDDASVADYGVLTYPESGGAETIQVLSDGEALGRAEFWADRYAQPRARPSPVTIRPRHDMDTLFPQVLALELCQRIEIERTPQGIGSAVTFTGLIDLLEHRITSDDWQTVVAISPNDIQDDPGFLVLDDPTDGELDVRRLAY